MPDGESESSSMPLSSLSGELPRCESDASSLETSSDDGREGWVLRMSRPAAPPAARLQPESPAAAPRLRRKEPESPAAAWAQPESPAAASAQPAAPSDRPPPPISTPPAAARPSADPSPLRSPRRPRPAQVHAARAARLGPSGRRPAADRPPAPNPSAPVATAAPRRVRVDPVPAPAPAQPRRLLPKPHRPSTHKAVLAAPVRRASLTPPAVQRRRTAQPLHAASPSPRPLHRPMSPAQRAAAAAARHSVWAQPVRRSREPGTAQQTPRESTTSVVTCGAVTYSAEAPVPVPLIARGTSPPLRASPPLRGGSTSPRPQSPPDWRRSPPQEREIPGQPVWLTGVSGYRVGESLKSKSIARRYHYPPRPSPRRLRSVSPSPPASPTAAEVASAMHVATMAHVYLEDPQSQPLPLLRLTLVEAMGRLDLCGVELEERLRAAAGFGPMARRWSEGSSQKLADALGDAAELLRGTLGLLQRAGPAAEQRPEPAQRSESAQRPEQPEPVHESAQPPSAEAPAGASDADASMRTPCSPPVHASTGPPASPMAGSCDGGSEACSLPVLSGLQRNRGGPEETFEKVGGGADADGSPQLSAREVVELRSALQAAADEREALRRMLQQQHVRSAQAEDELAALRREHAAEREREAKERRAQFEQSLAQQRALAEELRQELRRERQEAQLTTLREINRGQRTPPPSTHPSLPPEEQLQTPKSSVQESDVHGRQVSSRGQSPGRHATPASPTQSGGDWAKQMAAMATTDQSLSVAMFGSVAGPPGDIPPPPADAPPAPAPASPESPPAGGDADMAASLARWMQRVTQQAAAGQEQQPTSVEMPAAADPAASVSMLSAPAMPPPPVPKTRGEAELAASMLAWMQKMQQAAGQGLPVPLELSMSVPPGMLDISGAIYCGETMTVLTNPAASMASPEILATPPPPPPPATSASAAEAPTTPRMPTDSDSAGQPQVLRTPEEKPAAAPDTSHALHRDDWTASPTMSRVSHAWTPTQASGVLFQAQWEQSDLSRRQTVRQDVSPASPMCPLPAAAVGALSHPPPGRRGRSRGDRRTATPEESPLRQQISPRRGAPSVSTATPAATDDDCSEDTAPADSPDADPIPDVQPGADSRIVRRRSRRLQREETGGRDALQAEHAVSLATVVSSAHAHLMRQALLRRDDAGPWCSPGRQREGPDAGHSHLDVSSTTDALRSSAPRSPGVGLQQQPVHPAGVGVQQASPVQGGARSPAPQTTPAKEPRRETMFARERLHVPDSMREDFDRIRAERERRRQEAAAASDPRRLRSSPGPMTTGAARASPRSSGLYIGRRRGSGTLTPRQSPGRAATLSSATRVRTPTPEGSRRLAQSARWTRAAPG